MPHQRNPMATTGIKWPAIPRVIQGAGGPIRVRLVNRPHDDAGTQAWGTWDDSKREIQLARGTTIAHRWKVFFHEVMHATIDDAGLCHLLTPEAQETLCDAVSSSRMAELRGLIGQ